MSSFRWAEFLTKHGAQTGLSDFFVTSTGLISAMQGKRYMFLEAFDAGSGAFEDLLGLAWPNGAPELGLDALEPSADIGARRYRLSYYKTERGREMTLRLLPDVIRTPGELRVPPAVVEMFCGTGAYPGPEYGARANSNAPAGGLYLISGDMGSGKSSTVSALCLYLAEQHEHRVMSIEDPVEFMYPERHGKGSFTSRSVGTSCRSYEDALREVRRQHATVVIVGEIRNRDTAETALRLALIGIKVIATIHGDNVPATAAAFVAECGEDGAFWARSNLAQACRMIVSQKLLRNPETMEMVAIHEVLFNIPRTHTSVSATLREGRFEKLRQEIQNHRRSGMQTFEDSLNDACNDGLLPAEMRPDSNQL